MAAALQQVFQSFTHRVVLEYLASVGKTQHLEGVVMTGGCALNVLANQLIHDTLSGYSEEDASRRAVTQKHEPSHRVYVPPAPNDCGLSLGALWAVMPPREPQHLQYLGFRLWDEASLDGEASRWQAQSLSSLGGVEFLADLLAGGSAWQAEPGRKADKPIIAIVRGRQEFGPRALGHRSLVAVPDSNDMRDRMNRLKVRQWYRPVAPMIAEEALEEVFGRKVRSPYMTMAPVVRKEVRARVPAIVHLDGTARHQSVGKSDDPWLHALLLAVGRKTGLAVLINTSFNTKGKPIVNTVQESLKMLRDLPDLDFVLIEDSLFCSPRLMCSS